MEFQILNFNESEKSASSQLSGKVSTLLPVTPAYDSNSGPGFLSLLKAAAAPVEEAVRPTVENRRQDNSPLSETKRYNEHQPGSSERVEQNESRLQERKEEARTKKSEDKKPVTENENRLNEKEAESEENPAVKEERSSGKKGDDSNETKKRAADGAEGAQLAELAEKKGESLKTKLDPKLNKGETPFQLSSEKSSNKSIETLLGEIKSEKKSDKDGKSKLELKLKDDAPKSLEDKAALLKPEKENTATVILDPKKWSVHTVAGAQQTNSELREAGDTRKNRTESNSKSIFELSSKSSEIESAKAGGEGARFGMESQLFRRETSMLFEMRGQSAANRSSAENRQLFNDLVEKARMNLGPGGKSTATIRMNPEHLGKMTLNIEMQNNQLHARLLVDSSEVKKMMRDELELIRQELKLQGIQVESFSIKVREAQAAHSTEDFKENNNFSADSGEQSAEQNSQENNPSDSELSFLGSEFEEEIDNNLVGSHFESKVNITI